MPSARSPGALLMGLDELLEGSDLWTARPGTLQELLGHRWRRSQKSCQRLGDGELLSRVVEVKQGQEPCSGHDHSAARPGHPALCCRDLSLSRKPISLGAEAGCGEHGNLIAVLLGEHYRFLGHGQSPTSLGISVEGFLGGQRHLGHLGLDSRNTPLYLCFCLSRA